MGIKFVRLTILIAGAVVVVAGTMAVRSDRADDSIRLSSRIGSGGSTDVQLLAERMNETAQAVAKIERELATLSGRPRAETGSQQQAATKSSEETSAPLLDEEPAQLTGAHDASALRQAEKDDFHSEAVDYAWAGTAEGDLQAGLDSLNSEEGFEVVETSCRTTRCKAVISFPSYSVAGHYASMLVERALPNLSCKQSLYLPEPEDIHTQYQAELMLDCTNQRSGTTQIW